MKKILYWPGMGQSADILKYLKTELSKSYQLDIVNFEYDVGNLEPGKWKILNDKFDWWIGISLGASLLYYSYNYVAEAKRPNRLTIINPFSSREKLSIEKGFDLSKQWNFSPKEKNINVNKIELVASVYDFKIPTYHGIELLNNANSTNKRIVFINSNHTIDKKEEQIELAKILLNEDEKNERFNYCNIYKQ
jgi:hypothetical protein